MFPSRAWDSPRTVSRSRLRFSSLLPFDFPIIIFVCARGVDLYYVSGEVSIFGLESAHHCAYFMRTSDDRGSES